MVNGMQYHTRVPNRLQGYDYSQNGAYFITFCTQGRVHLFWKEPTRLRQNSRAVGARIARPSPCPELSAIGNVVEQAILQIPDKYPTVHLEKYAVMPNHVHLLLLIQGDGRAMRAPTAWEFCRNRVGSFQNKCTLPCVQKVTKYAPFWL